MAFKMKSSPMKRNFKVGDSPIKDNKGTIEKEMMHRIETPHDKDNKHIVASTEGKKGDPEAKKVEEKTTGQPSPK